MNNLELFLSEIEIMGFYTSAKCKETKEFILLPDINSPRWMIPLQKGVCKSNAMLLYEPTTVKGKYFKKMISLLPNLLCEIIFKKNIVNFKIEDEWLKSEYKIMDLSYSFYLGNRGPHNKVTIQISKFNNPVLYIKIASSKKIEELFRNEWNILNFLNKTSLKESIPEYVSLESREDLFLLAVSTVKTRSSIIQFSLTKEHVNFLSMLYDISVGRQLNQNFSYFKECDELLKKFISQNKEYEWLQDLFKSAVNKILNMDLKSCICHRDFTPWNIYFNFDKINVFDWEYSRTDYLPFFDILHFVIQKALLSTNLREQDLLEDIRNNTYILEYARRVSAPENCINAFCVLYLLDILFLYEFRTNFLSRDDITLRKKRINLLKLLQEDII